MSIALREPHSTDAEWLNSWLPSVAASVGYDADVDRILKSSSDTPTRTGMEALLIERDKERAGIVVCRPGAPDRRSSIIELVATPVAEARRGSGMQAAALLENDLRSAGVRTVYAAAPAVHGIAVYFWIRLGYRPLLRGEWPCERDGVAWLMRRIDEG